MRGGGERGEAIVAISVSTERWMDRKAEQGDGSGLDQSHGPAQIFTATNNTMTWRRREQGSTVQHQATPSPPCLIKPILILIQTD